MLDIPAHFPNGRARAGAHVSFLHRRIAGCRRRPVSAIRVRPDLRITAKLEIVQDRGRNYWDNPAAGLVSDLALLE